MRWALPACAAALAACAGIDEQLADDRAELAASFRERVGAELEPLEPGRDVEAEVRALLALPLDEDAALKVALLCNPSVRALLEELGVASAELVQAGLLRNPVFALDVYSFSSGTGLELALTQPLFDLLFLSRRKRTAQAELASEQARVSARLVALAFDLRRALVDVRAAERALALAQASQVAAGSARDLMLELHAAGNVTDPQRTDAELELAAAFVATTLAEEALVDAREVLRALLGCAPPEAGFAVAGELHGEVEAGLELENAEQGALAASLELADRRARSAAAAEVADFAAWEAVLSELELGVAAKREHTDGEWGLGPALSTAIPLWDFGGTRGAAADARLRRALAEHEALVLEVSSAARRLVARLRAAADRAEWMRENELPLAARLVTETLRDYNAMQIGAFDVLAVRRRELAAEERHLDALHRAWLVRVDLEELFAGHLNRERVGAAPRAPASATMADRSH